MPIKRAKKMELLGSSQLTNKSRKMLSSLYEHGVFFFLPSKDELSLRFSIKVVCKIFKIGDGIVY
jgi:hypothetical protein